MRNASGHQGENEPQRKKKGYQEHVVAQAAQT